MKITYYGTAAAEGWPALYCQCSSCNEARKLKGKNIRTRSQSLINDDLLIDFPPDTYLHMLNYGLDLDKIKDIIITHSHEDHLYIDDLANRQEGYCKYRASQVYHLYGNDAVKRVYDKCHSIPYNASLPAVVDCTEIFEYQEYQIGDYKVYPMLADHNQAEKCYIYIIVDKEGKTLLYAHDTGYLREDCFEFMNSFRFDYVSLDCNHGKENSRRNHMGMECCGDVKARMLEEKMADEETIFVVNHFSHNCLYLNHDEIEKDAKKYGFLVSYDGMQIEF